MNRRQWGQLAARQCARATLGWPLGIGVLLGAPLTPNASSAHAADEEPGKTRVDALVDTPTQVLLDIEGSQLTLHFQGSFSPVTRREATVWARRSASAVAAYLGRFPVKTLDLRLVPTEGERVRSGVTMPAAAPYVQVNLGRDTSATAFLKDWVLVHEMVHLAVPRVPRFQSWLHEGIATYVEGVARARAGITSAAQFWAEMARGLPQGLPQPGDQGLDHTPTWGRKYWGGALFCLLADVAMQRASAGRTGLQQALQGVLAAGGNYAVAWPVDRVLAVADAAAGQTILTSLYNSMKDQAMPIDLDSLWVELGVTAFATSASTPAVLLDSASAAWLRRAIV